MINKRWFSDTVCFRVLKMKGSHIAQVYKAHWDHICASPDLGWRDSNAPLVLKSMSDLSMRSVEGQVAGTEHAIIVLHQIEQCHYWGATWNSGYLLQAQAWLRKRSTLSQRGLETSLLRQVLDIQRRRKLSAVTAFSWCVWSLLPKYISEKPTFNYSPCCSQKYTSSQCPHVVLSPWLLHKHLPTILRNLVVLLDGPWTTSYPYFLSIRLKPTK